jgi:hypothetical protein
MKIENDQPVLSDTEFDTTARRDYYLDAGDSPTEAARSALDAMKGRKTKKFVEWLSKGTLTLDHGEVVDVQPDNNDAAA